MYSESDMEDIIREAFDCMAENEYSEYHNADINMRTFEDAMLLTRNHGLVVNIGDSEFQITIVKSR